MTITKCLTSPRHIHGQTIRTGVFVYSQYKQINDTGPARGKITFQNFTDFLLGMSAAQNGSPAGLSNVQSVTANEGVEPNGEIQYRFRTNYVSMYFQDNAKLSSRLTLDLGLRWEYCPPTFDTAGQLRNA
jgi:outer membrane receptor protein involved in Fe transport